jgi:hypothetical protein
MEGSELMTGQDCEKAIEEHRRLNGCDAEHILREAFGRILSEREALTTKLRQVEKELDRYREALEKIAAGRLNPDLGQIVGSEHYEGAWLDGVEMAREALGQGSGG